jgi:hypothetical protein
MKGKTKTTGKTHADESHRLIENAMKKPGVAELFRVYEAWQRFEQVSALHDQFTSTKQIVTLSTSSYPVVLQPW